LDQKANIAVFHAAEKRPFSAAKEAPGAAVARQFDLADEDRAAARVFGESADRSGKSMNQIAHEVSAGQAVQISANTLYGFRSPGKRSRFPLSLTKCVCAVLNDDSLQLFALDDKHRWWLEVGKAITSGPDANAIRALLEKLSGIRVKAVRHRPVTGTVRRANAITEASNGVKRRGRKR
jgi:hypothetical protein